jgi:N-acetylglucosamine-6-sulfatase
VLRGPASRSTRRRLGIACGALAAFLALLGLAGEAFEGAAPAQIPQANPNVVLVMTDDQTVEQMRALKRVRGLIGRTGTTFTNNFSTFPLCCPSRATYLTGQYSRNNRVRGNSPPGGGFYRLDSSNTLPVWLRDAGYATAHIGKYLNGYGTRDPRQVPSGWEEWHGSVDPTTSNYFDYCINENGRLVAYGADSRLATSCPNAEQRRRTYQGDLYSHKAVGYINQRAPAAQPFLLSVAYLAPHGGGPHHAQQRCVTKPAPRHRRAYAGAPLPRPPGFNERDVSDKPAFIRKLPRFNSQQVADISRDYQCRRESLMAVDEGVGAMVEALRAKGELDKTLFIFTSDNGWFQGEHRVPSSKFKVYEPSVRVPVLMRGPGVPRAKAVHRLTGNIDLASTIVDAADAHPRRTLDGVSLLEVASRPSLFAGRDILLENVDSDPRHPRYSAIRTSRYKYVKYVTGERELYDLLYDPYEQRSQHASPRYVDVRRRLASKLARLRRCAGATCRR